MRTQFTLLLAVVAGGVVVAACRDSSTAPRHVASAPMFLTANDTSGGGGGKQFHFVANGDGGSLFWETGDTLGGGGGGSIFGFLDVGRGGSTSNPQTFLSYSIQVCDPFFNCNFFGGSGLIPNRDLTGGLSSRHLHLSTNTTGNLNFSSIGPTGLVVVDWKANGFFTQSSSGTTRMTVFGFKSIFQGSSDFASANATGTVVGIQVSPFNFGNITTNHTVIIDISH